MSWLLERFKDRVRDIRLEAHVLYLAAHHPATPCYAKLVVVSVAAYALSPIDLIPDFIPVLGLLDDLLILPIGFALARRLIPAAVISECRARAMHSTAGDRPSGRIVTFVIVMAWVALISVAGLWAWKAFFRPEP